MAPRVMCRSQKTADDMRRFTYASTYPFMCSWPLDQPEMLSLIPGPVNRGLIRRSQIAQSRPTTAHPQIAASVRHEGSYVAAVLEGRGVSIEIGVAALDKDTGKRINKIYALFSLIF